MALHAYRRLGYSLSNPSVSRTEPPLPRGKSPEMETGSSPRRSSGLRVQFMDVEVFSLLPQSEGNGCNLACQGEAHPLGLDAFGERTLVKLLKWPRQDAGPSSCSFEQAFEIMVVVLIQAANRGLFFASPRLAFDVVIFPAVAGF